MRLEPGVILSDFEQFQSTHSLRSATGNGVYIYGAEIVSIHALLAECDSRRFPRRPGKIRFNPRTPCGVRHGNQRGHGPRIPVSIHALLAECDFRVPFARSSLLISFNPRTPCGVRPVGMGAHWLFCLVSIHALLAECDQVGGCPNHHGIVSIHALLAECDLTGSCLGVFAGSFNPRTPCGVRPVGMGAHWLFCLVSIHALLAECDYFCNSVRRKHPSFNPRTPCGVRQPLPDSVRFQVKFQSTHSLRSATRQYDCCFIIVKFQSTHSLRSATHANIWHPRSPRFQSTHSLRSATRQSVSILPCTGFQSTHSLRSATTPIMNVVFKFRVSIHALLAECDFIHA